MNQTIAPKVDINHIIILCPIDRRYSTLKNLHLCDMNDHKLVYYSYNMGPLNQSSIIFTTSLLGIHHSIFENLKEIYIYKSNIKDNYITLFNNYAWRYWNNLDDFIKSTMNGCHIINGNITPINYDEIPDVNLLNRCLRMYSPKWKCIYDKPYEKLTLDVLEDCLVSVQVVFSKDVLNAFVTTYNFMDKLEQVLESENNVALDHLINLLRIYHKNISINNEIFSIREKIYGKAIVKDLTKDGFVRPEKIRICLRPLIPANLCKSLFISHTSDL